MGPKFLYTIRSLHHYILIMHTCSCRVQYIYLLSLTTAILVTQRRNQSIMTQATFHKTPKDTWCHLLKWLNPDRKHSDLYIIDWPLLCFPGYLYTIICMNVYWWYLHLAATLENALFNWDLKLFRTISWPNIHKWRTRKDVTLKITFNRLWKV